MSEKPEDREAGDAKRPAGADVRGAATVHPEVVLRVLEALPGGEVTQRMAAVFQILSDPTRARIVHALSLEELCVGDVATVAGLSVSAASHQLKRLRDRGVVSFRKKGRLALYRLSDAHIRRLIEDGVEHIGASRMIVTDFG